MQLSFTGTDQRFPLESKKQHSHLEFECTGTAKYFQWPGEFTYVEDILKTTTLRLVFFSPLKKAAGGLNTLYVPVGAVS